jgi:hypothetical protein
MAKYYVTTMVTFYGEVEADSEEQAEQMGWDWEDNFVYDGVYSIEVQEAEDNNEGEDDD